MLLQYWLQKFGSLLIIWWCLLLFSFTSLLWLRFFWSNHKNIFSISKVFGVAVKDIASILTVISLESPSNSLVDNIIVDPDIFAILCDKVLDLLLNLYGLEFIIRVSIYLNINWCLRSCRLFFCWICWLFLGFFTLWFFFAFFSLLFFSFSLSCLHCSLPFELSELSLAFHLLNLGFSISL